ncbi:type I methionyl aminopeptidase [Candidatus Saccharibacteria bacterium]|nr:type I methionyl aminopeptidase [Candidatus Saccharibacteria bacterium]
MQKTPEQIEAQRAGGKILAQVLADLRDFAAPGVTGLEINDFVAQKLKAAGAEPSYTLEAPTFPGVICISINNAFIHGIPTPDPLEQGDKVSFDLSICYHGMNVDSAFTMIVGRPPDARENHLIETTKAAFFAGVKGLKAGSTTGDIGYRVGQTIKRGKLGVITDFIGHGIGVSMHEKPEVPNFGRPGEGAILEVGQTICIEPMVSLGSTKTRIADDGWTVLLNTLGAHYEHTVLITEDGHEILTEL